MNILIACEYSAVVRDAFLKAGHNAWSCDLLATDGRQGNHLRGDVRDCIEGSLHKFDAYDIRTGNRPMLIKWDMMIAHPDCTNLCSSGLHWNHKRPERAQITEDALDFVRFLMNGDIERICIENPVGCIGTRIKPASQYIQPYQFGEDASKNTGLWLKNLPLLRPTQFIDPRMIDGKPRWANQTDSGQNKLAPSATRWKDRARTYPGIANAMVAQWGQL